MPHAEGRAVYYAGYFTRETVMMTLTKRSGSAAVLLLMILSVGITPVLRAQSSNDISGVVVDEGGGVVAGAKVTLLAASGKTSRETTSGAAGEFSMSAVDPGTYALRLSRKNFSETSIPVVVAAGTAVPPLHVVLRVSPVRQALTVTANGPYVTPEASSVTKLDTPVMELPVSVHVVPAAVLEDQQVVSLDTAIQNVAGVIRSNDGYGSSDSFVIRGFDSNMLTYEDGLRLDEYMNSGFGRDFVNIQEVQIVKGPDSVLFGQAEPGGSVNVVSKKPQDQPSYYIQQQFGNYGFFRTTAGATGPLVNRRLLYRIDFERTDAGSFRNFINTHRIAVFPSFTWMPTSRDRYTFAGYYSSGSDTLDNGIPFLPTGVPANVPLSSNYADPGAGASPVREYYVKVLGSHSLSEKWKLRIAYKSQFTRNPVPNEQIYLGDTDSSGNLNLLGLVENYFSHWTHQVVTDANGQFNTWGIQHNIVVGFDFYDDYGSYAANVYFPPSINIYTPVWNQPYQLPDASTDFYVSNGETSWGIYAQDQMNLGARLHLLAGIRVDRTNTWDTGFGSQAADVHDRPKPTPRLGLLWQPVSHVSFYGSYTGNYGATALGSLTVTGLPLPPESDRQYEAGVKTEWLNKRLTVSSAVYRIEKFNVPAVDPANPLYSIAIGEARSRGVELDVNGQITRSLRLIGGYSYIDCRTVTDTNTPSLAGLRFPGVPYDSGSLWGVYEFQHDRWKGFRVGAGILARTGELAWESPDGVTYLADRISGFAIVNAMAAYGWQAKKAHFTLQVNAGNLLNKAYFATVNPSQALPGAPFTVMPALKVQF